MVSSLLSELDVLVNRVDMLQEMVAVLCLLDNKVALATTWLVEGTELMTFLSNSCMNRLATKGPAGEPMAAPHTCSPYLPWKRK